MIDRSKLKPKGEERNLKILKSCVVDDHKVLLIEIEFRHISGQLVKEKYLVCDCDYNDNRPVEINPNNCNIKDQFRKQIMAQAKINN